MRAPPIIGLTGTVGAGKSTVADMLRERGCVVCDSDRLARESFDDPAVRAALRARWGAAAFDGSGIPDRSAIARIVFADEPERAWLESIVHPWIEARRASLFAAAPAGAPALVIDAPLLLEAGLDAVCDAVWVVDASPAVRRDRVRADRDWDDAEFDRRDRAQWSAARKRAAATLVLDNDGDLATLKRRVVEALAGLGGR